MMDGFTNILLVVLIGLIGYLGKILYEKMEEFAKRIEAILISDIGTGKDVQQLRKDVDDHEERITDLEKQK